MEEQTNSQEMKALLKFYQTQLRKADKELDKINSSETDEAPKIIKEILDNITFYLELK